MKPQPANDRFIVSFESDDRAAERESEEEEKTKQIAGRPSDDGGRGWKRGGAGGWPGTNWSCVRAGLLSAEGERVPQWTRLKRLPFGSNGPMISSLFKASPLPPPHPFFKVDDGPTVAIEASKSNSVAQSGRQRVSRTVIGGFEIMTSF